VAVTSWLVDKSAHVRLQLGQVPDRDQWSLRISRGLVRLSTVTRLELGYSARSGEAGRRQFASPPLSLKRRYGAWARLYVGVARSR
jgi:hypothetical protein